MVFSDNLTWRAFIIVWGKMSLRFILGPAGSGKTDHCIRSLAARIGADRLGTPLLLLVPEQATFLYERALAAASPGGGFCRAYVSGFSRLTLLAYQRAGALPLPQLTEAGKLMLASGVIAEQRGQLAVFAAPSLKSGFAAQLVAASEELCIYGVEAEALFAAAQAAETEQAHSRSAARLRDIALLYQTYHQRLDGHYDGYAERMQFLAARIADGLLDDTEVWIDGFSEFTPCEQAVLSAMFARCRRVEICLCLHPAGAERARREEDPFYALWHTYAALRQVAANSGVEIEPPLTLSGKQGRFAANPELELVAVGFAGTADATKEQPPSPKETEHTPPSCIQLRQAADRRGELLAAGREIQLLVREQGLRYRDISIIVRDSQPYHTLLAEVFGDLGIPYFIDAKKPLLYHPLIDLVRAALETWAYRPHYRHIMRLLKNAFSAISREEADVLDNYCLAHGIRFYHWQRERWDFPLIGSEDEQYCARIEDIRARGTGPVLRFCQALNERCDARALHAALLTLLQELGVAEKLSAWAEAARAAGEGETAAITQQVWDKLSSFFAEAELLLGGRQYTAAELLDLYDAAFSGITLSTIPPGLDQVLVASLERSRNPELKAAFILGVNDGFFPRRIVSDSLFSDEDRRLLTARGIYLAPDAVSRQFRENYLVYIALTRSGGRLYVSWPLTDEEGKALLPSPLIRRLRTLFPALAVHTEADPDAAHLVGGHSDLALAAVRLRQARAGAATAPLWLAVYANYAQKPKWQPYLKRLEQGLDWQPASARLSRGMLARLYGHTLKSSVSRLEKYRLCPFSYFAAYGLKLRPRRRYQLTPADRGDLFHHVLAEVGRKLSDSPTGWQQVDADLAGLLVEEALTAYLPQFLSGILQSSARYAYLQGRIREALVAAVLLTAEHMRRGKFVPVAYEFRFGAGGEAPAFHIPLDDGRALLLTGQIDRIDMALDTESGQAYLRVIDYKTGNISLKREDIAAGLRLQLLVYLQVALANSVLFTPAPAQAAGIYYAPLHDQLELSTPAAEGIPAGLKLCGLTVADAAAVQLADPGLRGNSELLPVGYNPDTGSFYSRPAPLTPTELSLMREQLAQTLKDTAAAMLDGMIEASPLIDGGFDACAFCDHQTVCGFDRFAAQPRRKQQVAEEDDEIYGEE
jgi:ATP-dependent helicase/nuclease subunit B